MSMFDRFKEQASRAANGKYSNSSGSPHCHWTNFHPPGATAFGQQASRQIGDMATSASK